MNQIAPSASQAISWMSMWPVIWPRRAMYTASCTGGSCRRLATSGMLRNSAISIIAPSIRRWRSAAIPIGRLNVRKCSIYGIPVGPQNNELAGLVCADEHARVQFAQDVREIRRMDAAEHLLDGLFGGCSLLRLRSVRCAGCRISSGSRCEVHVGVPFRRRAGRGGLRRYVFFIHVRHCRAISLMRNSRAIPSAWSKAGGAGGFDLPALGHRTLPYKAGQASKSALKTISSCCTS